MSEEPQQNVPDYNVKSDKTGFNPFRVPVDIEGYYSGFWPLLILMISFIILLVYEVDFLRYRRMVLIQQRSQYADVEIKAKEQVEFVKGLYKDLKDLAATDPAAAGVMRDFFPSASDKPGAKGPSDTPKK